MPYLSFKWWWEQERNIFLLRDTWKSLSPVCAVGEIAMGFDTFSLKSKEETLIITARGSLEYFEVTPKAVLELQQKAFRRIKEYMEKLQISLDIGMDNYSSGKFNGLTESNGALSLEACEEHIIGVDDKLRELCDGVKSSEPTNNLC